MSRILTGIQSTNVPHLGNILGAILPAIELSKKETNDSFFFIADLHTLTSKKDPQFIQQVKIVSLTLAQALSDSIEIVTPYMLQSYSTVVEKLARVGALAILDAIGVIPGFGEVLDAILIVHNLIMTVMNVSRASVQITDISALLISNLIRIYKQNAQKVKAAHGRITTSTNQFQNTNNPSTETNQSGGNKKNNKSK
jgi:hypothetical protein